MKLVPIDRELTIEKHEIKLYAAELWPHAVRILGYCLDDPIDRVEARHFMDLIKPKRVTDHGTQFSIEGSNVLGLPRVEWIFTFDPDGGADVVEIEADGSPFVIDWG